MQDTDRSELTAAIFGALPVEWVALLKQATLNIDLDLVGIPIEKIRPQNAVERAIESYIDNFECDNFLNLIKANE